MYADINGAAEALDPTNSRAVTNFYLPLVQSLEDKLAALKPPEELAGGFGQALGAQQALIDLVKKNPTDVFAVDRGEAEAAFDGLGLTTCGSGSGDVAPSR